MKSPTPLIRLPQNYNNLLVCNIFPLLLPSSSEFQKGIQCQIEVNNRHYHFITQATIIELYPYTNLYQVSKGLLQLALGVNQTADAIKTYEKFYGKSYALSSTPFTFYIFSKNHHRQITEIPTNHEYQLSPTTS